jgi:hypothetical protein
LTTPHPQEKAHGPPSLLSQMLTALAEKPPASAGYRGSDLVLWRTASLRRFERVTAFLPIPEIQTGTLHRAVTPTRKRQQRGSRNRFAANFCRIGRLPRRHWKARVPSLFLKKPVSPTCFKAFSPFSSDIFAARSLSDSS